MVKSSTQRRTYKATAWVQLALALIILLAVNIAGQYVFVRHDFTDEKIYTLSDSTKTRLQHLSASVFVKVYLQGDFPADFKRLQNATHEMLDEMRVYAGGKLQYSFVDPMEGKNDADRRIVIEQMHKKGMMPITLTVNEETFTEKTIFPYAELSLGNGQSVVIPLLENQVAKGSLEPLNKSISLLEYKLMYGIHHLLMNAPVTIGFTSGNGEAGGYALYDIVSTLSKDYMVDTLHLDDINMLKKHFRVIVIPKPEIRFTEKEKYILDQYIMQGGRVLWLVDGVHISIDSLRKQGSYMATSNDLNLNDQLFHYGCRINPDLVMDLQANKLPLMTSSDQMRLFPWIYFPVVTPDGNNPIVKNLDDVAFKYCSSIDTMRNDGVTKTVLLHSSKYTRTTYVPWLISTDQVKIRPQHSEFDKSSVPLAVLLEGRFTSLYTNRISPKMQAGLDSLKMSFNAACDKNKMIVISDGDFIINGFDRQRPYPMGYFHYLNQSDYVIFDNKDFILNCIEYLADDGGLINTRSKTVKLRLLDKNYIGDNKLMVQLYNVCVPILIVIIAGLAYVFIRRRRYGSKEVKG